MTRELIFEQSQYGEGWTAWDGEHRDKIPGTATFGPRDFHAARQCAVIAWGNSWQDAIVATYEGAHTN